MGSPQRPVGENLKTEGHDTRLAALDFSRDIERLTEDFTGREWLFEEIDNWLHQTDQRFFILFGEPGAGKSAITALLTQVRPDNIVAYHFCIAGNVGTIAPNTVLRSLAAQLGESLPGYGQALANTIKPYQVSVNIKQGIGTIEAGAKVVGVVINHLTATDPEEELDILFRAPLTALDPPATPIFILIDSLDEAMTYQGQINLIHLLAKTNDLPQWVRFVCTTRLEQNVLGHFKRFKPFVLATESQENLADIDQYILFRVGKEALQNQLRTANVASENLTERVAELADGNFLYTKFLLNDIETGQQSLDDLAALPQSLDEIYHSFLRRFSDEDWDRFYRPILGKLAVAQEPITEAQLANFTDLPRHQVRRSLGVVDQYLDINVNEEEVETYHLFHQSMRNYLLNEDGGDLFWCDSREEQQLIATYYLENYQDNWSNCDLYGLRYLPTHLAAVGNTKDLQEIMLDFEWLRAKLNGTDTRSIIVDYDLVPDDTELRLVRDALQLAAYVLDQDKTQLPGQLLGRLLWSKEPGVQTLLGQAQQWTAAPWLRPLTPSLNSPESPLRQTLVFETVAGRHWREIGRPPSLLRSIGAVAVTQDGRRAIFVADGEMQIWDLERGHEIYTLLEGGFTTVATTPDGQRAVSGSGDGTLAVWNLSSGKKECTLSGHTGSVNTVAVTIDGQQIVSGSDDGTIKVWDLSGGKEERALSGHTGSVNAVAVTTDGQRIVSLSDDSTIKVWDLESGVELKSLSEGDPITDVAVTSDEQQIVFMTSSLQRTLGLPILEVWNSRSGDRRTLTNLSTPIRPQTPLVAMPDGTRLISGRYGGNGLIVWNLEKPTEPQLLYGNTSPVAAVAITPDSRWVVSASRDGALKLWDFDKEIDRQLFTGHTQRITAVAVTPDRQQAISGSSDGTIKVWDVESGRELRTIPPPENYLSAKPLAFTPNCQRVIFQKLNGQLLFRDLKREEIGTPLYGHSEDDQVHSVVITPDGRKVISVSDNTLLVWEPNPSTRFRTMFQTPSKALLFGHQPIHTLSADVNEAFTALAVSPDGRWVVTGSVFGTDRVSVDNHYALRVWNIENEAIAQTWRTGFTIDTLAVTPDGQQVITTGRSLKTGAGVINLWDLKAGTEIQTFPTHGGHPKTAVVTPDGRWVISALDDGTIKVWNLSSGELVAGLNGEDVFATCAIGSDNTTIILGAESGKVVILRLQGI